MGYNRKYGKGGSKKSAQALFDKLKSMGYKKPGGETYGAGDGDITPAKAKMLKMAQRGGLMGYMSGGSVLDDPMPGMMKYGGSKKKKKSMKKKKRK